MLARHSENQCWRDCQGCNVSWCRAEAQLVTAEGRLKEMEKAVGQQVGLHSQANHTEQLYHACLSKTVATRVLFCHQCYHPSSFCRPKSCKWTRTPRRSRYMRCVRLRSASGNNSPRACRCSGFYERACLLTALVVGTGAACNIKQLQTL